MHTEEDTFNKLRRASFDRMLQLIVPHCTIGQNVATMGNDLNLLRPNGWTIDEFKAEFFKPQNGPIIKHAYTHYYETLHS